MKRLRAAVPLFCCVFRFPEENTLLVILRVRCIYLHIVMFNGSAAAATVTSTATSTAVVSPPVSCAGGSACARLTLKCAFYYGSQVHTIGTFPLRPPPVPVRTPTHSRLFPFCTHTPARPDDGLTRFSYLLCTVRVACVCSDRPPCRLRTFCIIQAAFTQTARTLFIRFRFVLFSLFSLFAAMRVKTSGW